jgi:hypothetical protein
MGAVAEMRQVIKGSNVPYPPKEATSPIPLGNAFEWTDYVQTGFGLDDNEGKPGEALTDPMGAAEWDDKRRDLRGDYYAGVECLVRASNQFADDGAIRASGDGFRPVRTLPATATDAGATDAGTEKAIGR